VIADIDLSPASREEKSVIASYLREYLAEFGFRGTYPYFDQYWLESTRHPFLIRRGGERAGFAFVRSLDGGATHEMSEFYVLPEHRGFGVGRAAVQALLPIFPGLWRIPVQVSNLPGIAFWSRVLGAEVPASEDRETVVFLRGVGSRAAGGSTGSSSPMFQVRPFEERDRLALETIYRECRSEATWLPSAHESSFARDTDGEALLVAVGSKDEPEGFVSVWEPEAFIHHLYVRNESRRKGIATQLLDSLATRLPKPWKLKCVRANDVALAFYLAHGWLEVSSGIGEDGPYAVLEKGPA